MEGVQLNRRDQTEHPWVIQGDPGNWKEEITSLWKTEGRKGGRRKPGKYRERPNYWEQRLKCSHYSWKNSREFSQKDFPSIHWRKMECLWWGKRAVGPARRRANIKDGNDEATPLQQAKSVTLLWRER